MNALTTKKRESESPFPNIEILYTLSTRCVENIYRWSAIQTIITILYVAMLMERKKNVYAIKCTAGVHRYISTHAYSVANVNKFSSETIWWREKFEGKKRENGGSSGGGGNSSSSNNCHGTKKGISTQHLYVAVYARVLLISCWTGMAYVLMKCIHKRTTHTPTFYIL